MSQQNKLMGVGQSAASAAQIVGDVASGLTAAGTGQSTALSLSCACNYVETVASGTGVRLYGMTGRPSSIGDEQTVYNAGASTLSVYPPSGEQIVGAAQDAAFSLPAGVSVTFKKVKNTLWLVASGDAAVERFVPSGTGALTETVQSALRRMVHTDQYDTAGHFATALNALSGTMGLSPYVKIGNTTGNPASWGRATNVFNGTNDEVIIFGYNAARNGASIPDGADTSHALMMESNYNDGSTRHAEIHFNIAAPGGSYKRPFFTAMALSGGNSGLIEHTFLLSEVQMSFYSPLYVLEAAAAYTQGVLVHFSSLDTGGKDWLFQSSGSAAGLGAGHFFMYNYTNGRYGIILDKNGSVVTGDLAAIATNATDGFLYVPTCAGIPTGTPTSYTGKSAVVVDSTNNKAYIYSGGAWRILN